VVSDPLRSSCLRRQDASYRESCLPAAVRKRLVGCEASGSFGWPQKLQRLSTVRTVSIDAFVCLGPLGAVCLE